MINQKESQSEVTDKGVMETSPCLLPWGTADYKSFSAETSSVNGQCENYYS
jgi:hypothetical protein